MESVKYVVEQSVYNDVSINDLTELILVSKRVELPTVEDRIFFL